MTDADAEHTVSRNDEAGRYEIRIGDTLAGFTKFSPDDSGRLRFTHTEVDHAFEGRGLGSTLVREAMTDVAQRGETVRPYCDFVAGYLSSHEIPGLSVDWPRR
jgi:predicted GNAT family acetyltransferase